MLIENVFISFMSYSEWCGKESLADDIADLCRAKY